MKNSYTVAGVHCFLDRREDEQKRNYNEQESNKINCLLLFSETKDFLHCLLLIFIAFLQS